MLEYIVSENIDDRSLERAASVLRKGGVVAFPTDTTWSLGAAIGSPEGIRTLKRLGGKKPDSPLTVICCELSQLSLLCELGTSAFRYVKRLVPGPFAFILPSTNKAAKDFDLRRGELGVRIPANPVPIRLVETLGEPMLAFTAKKTMIGLAEEDVEFPEELLFSSGWELEDIEGVDLVLDPGCEQERCLSTVVDLRSGEAIVLRQGIGILS